MITRGVIYTDKQGRRHACVKANSITKYTVKCSGGLGQAVRNVTCDSVVGPNSKVKKCPADDTLYIVESSSSYYFVRDWGNNQLEVKADEFGLGFSYGSSARLRAHQEENLTVFYFEDKHTNQRKSPYFYLEW